MRQKDGKRNNSRPTTCPEDVTLKSPILAMHPSLEPQFLKN